MDIGALKTFIGEVFTFVTSPTTGAVASVFGALISTRVWYSLRDMRRRVLFRQRAPDAVIAIQNHASKINSFLQEFDETKDTITTEVALSLETLKAIVGKLHGPAKGSVSSAISTIKSFQKFNDSEKTRARVRNVYTQLLSAALAIEHLVEDSRQEL